MRTLLCVAAAAAGIGAAADEQAALGRKLVAELGDAAITLKLVIKETYSMGEFGSESSESTTEIGGTIITPDGLAVTSLMETDPSQMWNDMGMFDEEDGFKMETELTGVKIVHADGTEVDAQIVLRDKDLDLAFVRPKKKPESEWKHVDLSKAPAVEAFDEVFALQRMGKVVDRLASGYFQRIAGILERPRKLYVIGPSFGDGMPVFALNGECMGISVTRKLAMSGGAGAASMFMMSGDDGFNTAEVVVPGPDILEIAEQAPGYDD